MKIKTLQKNSKTKRYDIIDEESNVIVRFNDLKTAAVALRYLQGVEMTETERLTALSALSKGNEIIKTVELPSDKQIAAVLSNGTLVMAAGQSENVKQNIRQSIEEETPPANTILTVVTTNYDLVYFCAK